MPENPTPKLPNENEENLGADHALLQHHKTTKAVENLEAPLEGILQKTHESHGTLKNIEENTKPKEIQKMQIIPSENEEDDSALATTFFKMLRGKKGDKGDKHTDEELLNLIKPLIPAPIKGDKGDPAHTHTNEELLDLIMPLIPDVKDGETPSDEHLLSLMHPIISKIKIPEPIKPTPEELTNLIKPLIPEQKAEPITAEKLIEILKGKLSYDHLKNLPNLDTFRRQSSKTVSLVELDDIDLSGLTKNSAGKYQLGSGSGSGGTPTIGEIIAGSGTTFTLAAVPKSWVMIFANRNRLYPGISLDYTISGAVITTTASYNAGDLLADYL